MIVEPYGNEYAKAWMSFGDLAYKFLQTPSIFMEVGFYDGVVSLNVRMIPLERKVTKEYYVLSKFPDIKLLYRDFSFEKDKSLLQTIYYFANKSTPNMSNFTIV